MNLIGFSIIPIGFFLRLFLISDSRDIDLDLSLASLRYMLSIGTIILSRITGWSSADVDAT